MFNCVLVAMLITCPHGIYALNKRDGYCSIQFRAKDGWFAITATTGKSIDACDEAWDKLKAELGVK